VTVPKYGGVLVGPDQLRQVFNDTDAEVLWFIIRRAGGTGISARLKIADGPLAHLPGRPKTTTEGAGGVEWPPK